MPRALLLVSSSLLLTAAALVAPPPSARPLLRPSIRSRVSGPALTAVSKPARAAARPAMPAVIEDAAELLPRQAILENFVHHNPWEVLQRMEFFDALRYVEERSDNMSPGERLYRQTGTDPRQRANEAMAELGASYLDRGAAKWAPPERGAGFLHFFASLEGLGFASWRGHARAAAAQVRSQLKEDPEMDRDALAESVLAENLRHFEEDPERWAATTRAMLLDLPGWSGMFSRMQAQPMEAPTGVPVRLSEFLAVHSIMARSSVEAAARQAGWDPSAEPLNAYLRSAPELRGDDRPIAGQGAEPRSLQNPSGLAYLNQNFERREQLEAEYERVTLRAINRLDKPDAGGASGERRRPDLQFYTCFDEREESFRRHLEAAAGPKEVETFGVAGFFNLAIRHQEAGLRDPVILAPEGACPPLEHRMVEKQQNRQHTERTRLLARLSLAYERASFSPLGSVAIAGGMLPVSVGRLLLKSLAPKTTRALTEQFYQALVPPSSTDFAPPFTADEAGDKLAQLFKNAGVTDNFSRLIVATGHGSRSVNNPFDAAHNCGACCGREGGPNARLMARFANDKAVRARLRDEHGIVIPDDCWFVGGYHDTTSDLVELYDLDAVPASHRAELSRARQILDEARGSNALERCAKFMLAEVTTGAEALAHVETRSVDLGEARPELGHATNAAVILGRRELTVGRNLDRRAFLPSYDPYNDDDRGTNLETILAPALIVASGISLEYLFSTVEGGAGTKVPMNLVGNFGVQQGVSGDLLVGLPTQMTEMHSPLRALYLIDAPIARVEAVLGRREDLSNLVRNNWVRFFVRDPDTQQVFRQKDGEYVPVGLEGEAVAPAEASDFVPFTEQDEYSRKLKSEEDLYTGAAALIMLASCGLPLYASGLDAHTAAVTAGAATLGLASLGFSRRYLHGEFMYGRLALLSAGMVAGFNLVAVAPGPSDAALGWSLLGFCSTFLIGAFNDRPTARDNAAFAFGAYQLSDAALLVALAFGATNGGGANPIAAAGLLLAAAIKSSQFPLTGLFMRSMEGASSNSALGYAGLSAHAGVLLLAGTMDLWFGFEWARAALFGCGLVTAVQSGCIANIRADRKGSLAAATSATLGAIYVVLAAGYPDAALLLSFGHAAFRMNQVLRSANTILDTHKLESALGHQEVSGSQVPEPLYKLGWAFNRVNTDLLKLPDLFQSVDLRASLRLSRGAQYAATAALLLLVGAIHAPVVEEHLAALLASEPAAAVAMLSLNVVGSTALVRFLLGDVLDFSRFRHGSNAAPVDVGSSTNDPEAVDGLGLSAARLAGFAPVVVAAAAAALTAAAAVAAAGTGLY